MDSHRLWQYAQGLHEFKPGKIPTWRRVSRHEVPPLVKKLFTIDTCFEREKLVFSNGVTLNITPILQGRPDFKSSWTTQNELHVSDMFFKSCIDLVFFISLLLHFDFFERVGKRIWSWVGGEEWWWSGGSWEMGKYVNKLYYMEKNLS